MSKVDHLEQKAWYRLFKVIYVAAIIISSIVIIMIAWGSIPKDHVDTGFNFSCSKEAFYTTNHTLSETSLIPTGNRETESTSIDQALRGYCQQHFKDQVYWFGYPDSNTQLSNDPSFNLKYALKNVTEGSWATVITDIVVGFGIEVLVFGLIGWIFIYVATGETYHKK